MDEFDELIAVARRLNNPEGGCPWDLEQTFKSLKPYILEEAYEVLEAIDDEVDTEIISELGDLFYTVIFYAKVAEREGRFSLETIIQVLKDKLVRRHPHVFGDQKADSPDAVIEHWEKVKKEEYKTRVSALDGIPKTLPSLMRAQKILKRMEKSRCPKLDSADLTIEEACADKVLQIVLEAIEAQVDLESALRKALDKQEKYFRHWELQSIGGVS